MSDKKILIVAQVPPPFYGQSIMQKYLVDVNWLWCKKEFVRMNFSDEVNEVGVFRLKKIRQLVSLIRSVRMKSPSKFELVYYPPGGPNRVPIYRDVIMLFFLKSFSKKIILHFHAGGIDQIFNKVTKFEAFIIKKAFKQVDGVIVLTDWLKKEVEWCGAKRTFVVGNGITDVFTNFSKKTTQNSISFLFVGNLKKEKGIFTLLESTLILKKQGESFRVRFIGSFCDVDEEQRFFKWIDENKLSGYIEYLGVKSGNEKWQEFEAADVFCMPTYETEAMPISILEAMMFEMPVITTKWRSIPDLIKHGENGLLFEPDNSEQLAICMKQLIHNDEQRRQLGIKARKDYLQNFTLEKHLEKMESVFREVISE